mmetsp:Transcript_93771/g.244302  ORF Transcript_93771/g.244302 Transcript_93771/m.244302 type:complete len:344 (-) Transcript_93771:228-1259(-)
MAARALALLAPLAGLARAQDGPSLEDFTRELRAKTSSFFPTGRSALRGFGGFGQLEPTPLQGPRPPTFDVKILRKLEHPHAPWTQGLEFASDGRLIETCGDFPAGVGSFVRVLDPDTGKVRRSTSDGLIDEEGKNRFIEGIVESGKRWYATTYEDKLAIEYDKDFKVVSKHPYPYNGWGLANSPDGRSFLVTNGTEYVMSLAAGTWKYESTKVAHCMGKRLRGLNELEMVEDFAGTGPKLLANLVNTRLVFAMDPETMECAGVFHLEDTEPIAANERGGYHVANGIAYNKKSGTFFVTGKNWESMYEIAVSKAPPRVVSHAGDLLESHLALAGEYKPLAHSGM